METDPGRVFLVTSIHDDERGTPKVFVRRSHAEEYAKWQRIHRPQETYEIEEQEVWPGYRPVRVCPVLWAVVKEWASGRVEITAEINRYTNVWLAGSSGLPDVYYSEWPETQREEVHRTLVVSRALDESVTDEVWIATFQTLLTEWFQRATMARTQGMTVEDVQSLVREWMDHDCPHTDKTALPHPR